MTGDPGGAAFIIVALWLMNGDPMNPTGRTVIPDEPDFTTRRECMLSVAVRYAGALDPRRGIIECVPK